MPVAENRDPRAIELRLQVGLRAVRDDEIRAQGEDALDVRVEQRADARQRLHLGRELVVAADGDDLRPGADGKEHLGQRRNQRHDARGSGSAAAARTRAIRERERCAPRR